ncbi:MAG: cytochrome c family protein [Polyangiaceae bacterium]|nr:cytochrome c family protein [Polyangiaceae bacterium]
MQARFYAVLGAALVACAEPAPSPRPVSSTRAEVAATSSTSFVCDPTTNFVVTFGSSFQADVSLANQTDADCYGWQEFIALNWPASGSSFGSPGDLSAVTWQGWMDVHQLFQADGSAPPAWGTPPQISGDCLAEAGLTADNARDVHPLVNATKFSSEFLTTSDAVEAFPNGAPAWLGDVNGNNVWYEVRVNQDEYNFVVANQYYNAENQLAFYTKQSQPPTLPLQLPAGCNQSLNCPAPQTGAVELKAAWMEVPNPSDAKWNAYKLTSAVVVDPKTQKCELVTVALVGMHIIHKTQSQPTWIWATFEHKDNAPNAGTSGSQSWNFNNPQCASTSVNVPTACQYNGQATVQTSCTPNTAPSYEIGDGCPAATPTQVTRVNAIDSTAAGVNETVTTAIASNWSDSVWQNYMLVNVVWSTNPPVIPPACSAGSPGCQGVTTPQLTQSLNPQSAVANTVLETYIQDHDPKNPFAKSNCVLCHQYATVPGAPSNTPYASDFSFALGEAQSPSSASFTESAKATKRLRAPRERKIRRIFR